MDKPKRCAFIKKFIVYVLVLIFMVPFFIEKNIHSKAICDTDLLCVLYFGKFNDSFSFGITSAITAMDIAILVFLYSQYHVKSHAMPIEWLIDIKIGHETVIHCIITTLIVSLVCSLSSIYKYYTTSCICFIGVCCFMCWWVSLISSLMNHKEVSKLIKKRVKEEQYKSADVLKKVIVVNDKYYQVIDNNLYQIVSKYQIYYWIKCEVNNIIFTCKDNYELGTAIEDVCVGLIESHIQKPCISFLYMYDLIWNVLKETNKANTDWKLSVLNFVSTKLDEESTKIKFEKLDENNKLIPLYLGFICAILTSKSNKAKKFLWFDFYYREELLQKFLTRKLFMFTVKFSILLKLVDPNLDGLKVLKETDCTKFTDSLYFNATEDIEKIQEYIFALSILDFGTEEYIKRCFDNVRSDLENKWNKDYMPKTEIGIIMRWRK